jgi:hypothetical protein
MTYSQRIAISEPAQGLLVYQSDVGIHGQGFYYNQSTTSTPDWVYVSNSSISERNNYVLVKSLSDFPTPSGSVITLTDNFTYEINGLVNIAGNTLAMGENTSIIGLNKLTDGLIYTGSGNMITASNKNSIIKNLRIISEESGSKVFNVSGSTNIFKINDNIFEDCNSLGSIDGGEFVYIEQNLIEDCLNGFECKGTMGHLFYNNNKCEDNDGVALYIPSGTFEIIQIQANYLDVNTGQSALNISLSASVLQGLLSTNFFMGGGTYLTGINSETLGWIVQSNTLVSDDNAYGFCRLTENSSATTISSTSTYYKINGTTEGYGERFNYATSNKLIYNGSKEIKGKYVVNGNLKTSGTNQDLRVAVYVNGSLEEYVKVKAKVANDTYTFSLNGQNELEQNDYLELYVRNETSTTSVLVEDFQFTVSK